MGLCPIIVRLCPPYPRVMYWEGKGLGVSADSQLRENNNYIGTGQIDYAISGLQSKDSMELRLNRYLEIANLHLRVFFPFLSTAKYTPEERWSR